MSIEKRKKGKKPYIARVYIGSKDGVPRHRSKSFALQKDAKEFEAKYRNFKNNSVDRNISDKVLLSQVFLNYILEIEKNKKDNTIKSYKANFNKWIDPHLGDFQIGNINHLTITRYFSIIKKKGVSNYMSNYIHIILNEIFKFATNSIERYVIENPMQGLPKAQLEYNPTTTIKFWDKDQVPSILNSMLGDHYYPIVVFMINTGLRDGEAMVLSEESFDFKRDLVHVNEQLTFYEPKENEPTYDSPTFIVNSTKGSEARSIPLNKQAKEAAQILVRRAKEKGHKYLLTPKNKSKKGRVVLKRGHSNVVIYENILSNKTLGNFIASLASEMEVENIGPHGLRHTFAANFLMNGGDLFTLSKLLGHADIKSTQIYAHLTNNYLKSAMKIYGFGG